MVIAKLVQDLPRRKRNGYTIALATASSMGFDKAASTSTATGLYNNLTFLPEVADEIKNHPDAVLEKLQKMRELRESFTLRSWGSRSFKVSILPSVLSPKGMRLSVAGNILAMPEPRTAWTKNFLQMPVSSCGDM